MERKEPCKSFEKVKGFFLSDNVLSAPFVFIIIFLSLLVSSEFPSWPLLILISFFSFKKQLILLLESISDRIKNLKSVGNGKAVFHTDQKIETIEDTSSGRSEKEDSGEGVYLKKAWQRLIADYKDAVLRNEMIRCGAKTLEDLPLETLVAENIIALFFERSYRIIYGTQLAFLAFIVEKGVPETRAEARKYYNIGVKLYSEDYKEYSFEQWLNYLLGKDFLEETDDGKLKITNGGLGLLRYIDEHNYPMNKQG